MTRSCRQNTIEPSILKSMNIMLISRLQPTAAQIQPEAIFSLYFSSLCWDGEARQTPWGGDWAGTVKSRWWQLLVSSQTLLRDRGPFWTWTKVSILPSSTLGIAVYLVESLVQRALKAAFSLQEVLWKLWSYSLSQKWCPTLMKK